jgi:hypothetical protein
MIAMNPDGSGVRQLGGTSSMNYLHWSPDGRMLIGESNLGITFLNVGTPPTATSAGPADFIQTFSWSR